MGGADIWGPPGGIGPAARLGRGAGAGPGGSGMAFRIAESWLGGGPEKKYFFRLDPAMQCLALGFQL